MITGLQITMRGEELSQRITERIRMHEAAISALDERIQRRAGDQPFDIRPEDGFETFGELESELRRYRGRVSELTLIRDKLLAGEVYTLRRADLRLADLISPDPSDTPEISNDLSSGGESAALDGLKVTIPGEELRSLLEQRIHRHQRRAHWWRQQHARTLEEQTEEDPLLPDHMCANEAERHDWRADVLGFIRDHIDSAAAYRLGEADLAFGELLPEKPEWMEQEDYEERTSVGFHLERLTKSVGALMPGGFAVAAQHDGDEVDSPAG